MICKVKETNTVQTVENLGIINSINTFSQLSDKVSSIINTELPYLKNNKLLKELVIYHCTK